MTVTDAPVYAIRPTALDAYLELLTAAVADPPPCTTDPDAWTGEPPDLDAAAFGCLRCPILTACSRYVAVAGEEHGVWAATVRTRTGRLRHLTADPIDTPEAS